MEISPFAAAVFAWWLNGDAPLIPYIICYGAPPSLPFYPLINVYGPLSAVLEAQPCG